MLLDPLLGGRDRKGERLALFDVLRLDDPGQAFPDSRAVEVRRGQRVLQVLLEVGLQASQKLDVLLLGPRLVLVDPLLDERLHPDLEAGQRLRSGPRRSP